MDGGGWRRKAGGEADLDGEELDEGGGEVEWAVEDHVPDDGGEEDVVGLLERNQDGLAHEEVGEDRARETHHHRRQPARQRMLSTEQRRPCKYTSLTVLQHQTMSISLPLSALLHLMAPSRFSDRIDRSNPTWRPCRPQRPERVET